MWCRRPPRRPHEPGGAERAAALAERAEVVERACGRRCSTTPRPSLCAQSDAVTLTPGMVFGLVVGLHPIDALRRAFDAPNDGG